jgi:proliferating cell nuclear antigen PCNA
MDNYIIYLETTQSKIIKSLFEVLKDVFMGHINLIFSQNGLQLKMPNGTEKSLVFLNLHNEEFEEFYCANNEFIAGVDSTNLHKLTKCINSKDSIKLFVSRDDLAYINLTRINTETGCKYEHKLKLYNVPYLKQNIYPTKYFHSLSLKSIEFQIACKNLNNLNCENVDIIFKKESILLNSSNEFCDTSIEIKQQQDSTLSETSETEENMLFNTEDEEIFQGNYSLQYILLFTKATTLDKNFEIYLNPEKPLTMSYAVGSLGTLDFMLEPNFTDSDEESLSE